MSSSSTSRAELEEAGADQAAEGRRDVRGLSKAARRRRRTKVTRRAVRFRTTLRNVVLEVMRERGYLETPNVE